LVATLSCACTDELLYSTTSPQRKRTVLVSRRNCGATSGFTTVVSERRGWIRGNLELLEIDGEAIGEKQLRNRWLDDNEIVVAADSALTIHPSDLDATDLKVGYAPGTRLGRRLGS